MKKIKVREGKIHSITLQKDYILLKTKDTLYHLPLTTEIIHSATGQALTLKDVTSELYFQNYFYNGQHVLVVNEQDAFFGVMCGEYHAEKSMIDDQLMMRHNETTRRYGAKLADKSKVIAFCKILTRSIPPQGTPIALFVFS
ncbi:MAG: hypothetical protein KBT36_03980 [Kurthia sp.]|nr:hypothetical protein [Candidatus Kurthia equi]